MRDSAPPSRQPFLLTLTMMAFYPTCTDLGILSAMATWTERAASLAQLIAEAEDERGALDIFSNCLPDASSRAPNGLTVRTHSDVDPRLRDAILWAPDKRLSIFLLKWAVVRIVDCEFVLYIDLDIILLTPRQLRRPGPVVQDWVRLLHTMRARDLRLATKPDGASPLNGGMLFFRPTASLYEAGLAVLRRANESFSVARGWEGAGAPRDVIPKADDIWSSRAGPAAKALLQDNAWRFYCANSDQGFFIYMFRVKFPLSGGDLPFALPDGTGRTSSWCVPHCSQKPWVLPTAPTCLAAAKRPRRAFGDDQLAQRQVRWALDAAADIAGGRGRVLGNAIFPARLLLAIERHLNGSVECHRRAALATEPLLTAARWEQAVGALRIDKLYTNAVCHPDDPRGVLFFTSAKWRAAKVRPRALDPRRR